MGSDGDGSTYKSLLETSSHRCQPATVSQLEPSRLIEWGKSLVVGGVGRRLVVFVYKTLLDGRLAK